MQNPQPLSLPLGSVPTLVGRYEIVGVLGRGGMATVYLGRSAGEAGFSRLFAVKVLHPHLADDPAFVSMLLDEGRIAARLHHPNVVPIVDLGSQGDLHFVVMEYVEGCALQSLLAKHRDIRQPRLIIPVFLDALCGLYAAHTITDDDGKPLNLVHRDVSPQNIVVGVDGTARLTDFGVAHAESRINSTRPGQVKGKIAFMSPEQIRSAPIDCRSDVFSAGCLLWSALTGRRLFLGSSDAATMSHILEMKVPPPSTIGLKPPAWLDEVCLRALERDKEKRWATAADMEEALREAALKNGLLGSRREVAEWVTSAFGDELKARRGAVRSLTAARAELPVSADSSPSTSGLRAIPQVGASEIEVDVEAFTTGVSKAASRADVRAVTQAGFVVSSKGRIGALIAVALLIGVLGTWLVLRSVGSRAAAPSVDPSVAATATAPTATPSFTIPAFALAPLNEPRPMTAPPVLVVPPSPQPSATPAKNQRSAKHKGAGAEEGASAE